jgi:hypothetical protein
MIAEYLQYFYLFINAFFNGESDCILRFSGVDLDAGSFEQIFLKSIVPGTHYDLK